jgi:hypothetical protein
MMALPEGLGPCEVINETDLQYRTQHGWRLVAIVQEQGTTTESDNVHNPQSGIMEYVTKSYPATFTRYIVTQSADEALNQLLLKIDQTKSECEMAWERANKAEAKLRDVEERYEKDNQRLQQQVVDLQLTLERNREELWAGRQRADQKLSETNKLQEQIKRVWIHVGIDRMRQILGESVKCPLPVPEPRSAHERVATDDDDDIPF